MRNFLKLAGVIALASAIVFTMTACPPEDDDDNGGGGGGGSAFLGEKLVISGEQVYTAAYNSNYTSVTFSKYNGNLTIEDENLGTVTITGGKLSYTIKTPDDLEDIKLLFGHYEYNGDDYDNPTFNDGGVTVSNANAKCFILYDFYDNNYDSSTGTSTIYSLSKINYSTNTSNTSYTRTYEEVYYVYVDKNVTISREGETDTGTASNGDGSTYNITYKTNTFSLALKTGWNVLYTKRVESYTYNAGNYDKILSSTQTTTISLNNPSSVKWVLDVDEWEGGDEGEYEGEDE